jgi:hypothetical protein
MTISRNWRWILGIAGLVLFILVPIARISLQHRHHREIERQRAAAYEFDREKYSELFPVGTPRKTVENDLRAMGIPFVQYDGEDLIKIGVEPPELFCEQSYRFVSLNFSKAGQHDAWIINDRAELQQITVEWRGICL